ncbi:hypothetical protein ACFWNK_34815 [Streptomyces sp. NPDC058417]|uniref:DinB/UmuC family translesion DNA polymerase n=1 Tax=unclassified Streptomyces TaxID=2593676 RepID=UPI00364F7C71
MRPQRPARRDGLRPHPARTQHRHRRLPRRHHRFPAPPADPRTARSGRPDRGGPRRVRPAHRRRPRRGPPAHPAPRLLGARAARALHEQAHGRDPRTTGPAPAPAPETLTSTHPFDRDELDPAAHRRTLLALADDLGTRLRTDDRIASGLTCTVHYADRSSTRRGRRLPEATHHTLLLARTAYAIYESLGLQRARVRSIGLRADTLGRADAATRQLTFDARDDKLLAVEAITDRARARYGHDVLQPASLAVTRTPPEPR